MAVHLSRDDSTEFARHAASAGGDLMMAAPPDQDHQIYVAKEDRYGGMLVQVPVTSRSGSIEDFEQKLCQDLQAWRRVGKGGIWLQVPVSCAKFLGAATSQGFVFHHAKPEYAMLAVWLRDSPSPLPKYAFTRIGVGGVVLNSKGEVLMVKEAVSAVPKFQGAWKLPGGLADPGEQLAETAMREVQEETGVTASLIGVVSFRHNHCYPHGQDDMYFLVKLRAVKEDIAVDGKELRDARWMPRLDIEARVACPPASMEDKFSENNWKMIRTALDGGVMLGTEIPNSVTGQPSVNFSVPGQMQ